MNYGSWGSLHLPTESSTFQGCFLSSSRVCGTGLVLRWQRWEWWEQSWKGREDAVANHITVFSYETPPTIPSPPPPRVCVHEVCRKASKLLKYNQLTTFREVAASSLFHFMMSLWRRLVWELLSHTVMNWTCNFSCQLELGSDSHWKMAPDTLTPSACFLPSPMRNSSPGYMLILSPITTSPPTFTGSPQ